MEVLILKGVYEHVRTSPYRRLICDFISSFEADNGYAPSVRQIKDGVGLRSTSTVHYHINTMREEGLLTGTPFKHRNLAIAQL